MSDEMSLIESFEKFLKEKHPDICMACWGKGRGLLSGNFIKNVDFQCPDCKGTGEIKTR